MSHWAEEAVFYHIYPLGLCGAPAVNDLIATPRNRLEGISAWIGHIKSLGANAVYIGPLFESHSHGYDTVDYYNVDRRLGDNAALAGLSGLLHENGIRIVLDAVFNHVGRGFLAFKDLLAKGCGSEYREWFSNVCFGKSGPYGDPFIYDTWNGHYSLVKLNLKNEEVKSHIFTAVRSWMEKYDIDGLRLDCADCLDPGFIKELRCFCKSVKPDFWLLGELTHGDYNCWVNGDGLDSATNYECYKGLYSSHNDRNYFEIAYSLNRQYNKDCGIYRDLHLYNFADNHDVVRVRSVLKTPAYIYPLYALLFTMPGIPSIYYGSEWGFKGEKSRHSDAGLRPGVDIDNISQYGPDYDLAKAISKFSKIRSESNALKYGSYEQLLVKHEQFAFARRTKDECVIAAFNSSNKECVLTLDIPAPGTILADTLNNGERFAISANRKARIKIYPCWARVLNVI